MGSYWSSSAPELYNKCCSTTNIWLDLMGIIVVVLLIALALFFVYTFYVCDSLTCVPFKNSNEEAVPGTLEYDILLLQNTFEEGIWPIPFLGGIVISLMSIWFVGFLSI